MQVSEVGKLGQGMNSSRAVLVKHAAVQRKSKRLRTTVQALAAPATRAESRGDLQTAPPPSRFPDVELSVAVPAGFAEQAVPSREATAHATAVVVSTCQVL